MRRLLSIVLMVTTVVMAFSTGQITEQINDNGVDKGLTRCLLELDSVSFSKIKERIPSKPVSTALWRNYIGHWTIKNDSLFLDSVLVRDKTSDNSRFVTAIIDDIYAMRRTPSGYFADWVTDTFRVVSGKVIRYQHMGWKSDWENEELVSVNGGLIKGRIVYENRLVNPASEDEDRVRTAIDSLELGYIPKRIVLRLGYRGFDDKGTPTGYKVKVLRSCGDTIIDNKVVGAFKDSTVMRRLIPVYYIQGKYNSWERTIPISAGRDHLDDSRSHGVAKSEE